MTTVFPPPDSTPSLTEVGVERAVQRLAPHVVRTPVVEIDGERLGIPDTRLVFKLELLQTTNAFKFRGAMNHVLALAESRDCSGVVTVSSGNHGIALAEAGRRSGVRVVVLMGQKANPWRRERIASLGAEVRLLDNLGDAFAHAARIAAAEQLRFVHPYDGVRTLEGTASLGLEFAAQAGRLDAVVLPIGGGGLAAGVAFAMQTTQATLACYGVEPEGAPTMTRALAAGSPTKLERLETIADSLAAPIAAPMSFELCRARLREVLLLRDSQIIDAMKLIYSTLRQAVEPAAAISTAAILGPLRERLRGRRVGVILCGANQDPVLQIQMLTTAVTDAAGECTR